jgi:signal transduction histidine kinase
MGGLVATIAILLYFWQTGDRHRAGEWLAFTNLFRRPQDRPSVDDLRSEYEQRIREAAGQEERNRLARDLHDSIKQQIFVIQTAAATAEARFTADEAGARQAIEQVRSSAREAMVEMEVMLDQLRAAPLGNVGLVESLKKQCEALGFRTGARVEFTGTALPPVETIPPGAQQTIFRIAQEALANVARHARATLVEVTLGTTDTGALQLKVTDDGAGFDAARAASGMGLSNMQARAAEAGGSVTVRSQPGNTSVVLSVPAGIRQADWGNYRRRVFGWAALVVIFVVVIVLDLTVGWRRNFLVTDAPILLFNLVVFARAVVAYRRVSKRRYARPWEESTSHS